MSTAKLLADALQAQAAVMAGTSKIMEQIAAALRARKPKADEAADAASDAEEPKKAKRGRPAGRPKKVRDETEPRRPASAFLMFQSDARKSEEFAKPDMSQKEKMAKIAERWRSLSEEEKKPYQDKAASMMADYRTKHSEWKVNHSAVGSPSGGAGAASEAEADDEDAEELARKALAAAKAKKSAAGGAASVAGAKKAAAPAPAAFSSDHSDSDSASSSGSDSESEEDDESEEEKPKKAAPPAVKAAPAAKATPAKKDVRKDAKKDKK